MASKTIDKPISTIKDRLASSEDLPAGTAATKRIETERPAKAKKRPISLISFRLMRSFHGPRLPHKGKVGCGSQATETKILCPMKQQFSFSGDNLTSDGGIGLACGSPTHEILQLPRVHFCWNMIGIEQDWAVAGLAKWDDLLLREPISGTI